MLQSKSCSNVLVRVQMECFPDNDLQIILNVKGVIRYRYSLSYVTDADMLMYNLNRLMLKKLKNEFL